MSMSVSSSQNSAQSLFQIMAAQMLQSAGVANGVVPNNAIAPSAALMSTTSGQAGSNGNTTGGSIFQALSQALSAMGVTQSTFANSTVNASSSSGTSSPQQAMQKFIQSLAAALKDQSGQSTIGQNAATQAASSSGTTSSTAANSNPLAQADSAYVKSKAGSGGRHHHGHSHGGDGDSEAASGVTSLLNQLVSNTQSVNSSTATDSSNSTNSNDLSNLQQSAAGLFSTVGLTGSNANLGTLLQGIAQNIANGSNTGQFVDLTA